MVNELLRGFSAKNARGFSKTLNGELLHSGEARKICFSASPGGLLHNYLEKHSGEARKTCFSASPYKGTSLLEKVGPHRVAAPFGRLAA